MVKQYWKQKRTLTDGLTACCNPSTAKATKHHRYGVFISQSPANRKCARWVCPVLPTAPYNVAYQRCYHPSTNKTSCLVLLVDDLTEVRAMDKIEAGVLQTVDAKIAVHEAKQRALQDLFKTLLHQLMTAQLRVNHLDIDTSEVTR